MSVIRSIPRLMFIIIPIVAILLFILLAWQHAPVYCHTDLNSTSDVILSNLGKCIDNCWRKHDFGSDLETDDCYVVDVFIQDKNLTKEDIDEYFSDRGYVKVYLDFLNSSIEQKVRIRYNATGGEISLMSIAVISPSTTVSTTTSITSTSTSTTITTASSTVPTTTSTTVSTITSTTTKSTSTTTILSENRKDPTKYSNKEVFLINDQSWREVLELVSLTTWTENNIVKKYPMLIYHEESPSFDADSVIYFMQQYNTQKVTIIGNTLHELDNLLITDPPLGAGLDPNQIQRIHPSDYLSYWTSIKSIVVVNYDNYKEGLMASVFASYKNAPILFVDSANLDVYKNALNNKDVIIVGNLDPTVLDYINMNAKSVKTFTLEELQQEYIKLTNTDKLVLVNSNDLNIKFLGSYSPDKSSTAISSLYTKHSLAAPILAVAKYEVIIDAESSNYQAVDQFVEDKISFLNMGLPYLTIVASPEAIPMSRSTTINDGCGWANRVELDGRYYGSLGTNEEYIDLPVGRIFGISSSDVSAYIARDVFFEEISKNKDALLVVREDWQPETVGGETNELVLENYARNSYWTNDVRNEFNQESFYSGYTEVDTHSTEIHQKYDDNYLILYSDHGTQTQFVNAMDSFYLKNNKIYLKPSVVVDLACATCKYFSEKVNLFCVQGIRRGVLAQQGAVDISYWHREFDEILKGCFLNDKTIGEAYRDARNKDYDEGVYNFCTHIRGDPFYALLGDPTFKPKWW